MRIVVIGGGAAGFFSALAAKQFSPDAKVIILEKSAKVLAKVRISGGGRCNVTNATFDNQKLAANYPRGEKFLRKAFDQFNAASAVEWFESRNVALKTYPDNCIFPQSNDSVSIINCFLKEATDQQIRIQCQAGVTGMEFDGKYWQLQLTGGNLLEADRVIVTIGGQPKKSGLYWLEKLGLKIIEPVPSLFTFNMPGNPVRELMGNVVENATVRVEGTKLTGKGPLLVTHWGMSGPAVLQLSAWGARLLAEKNYQFSILVNWLDDLKDEEVRKLLEQAAAEASGKMIVNYHPFPMTGRLWTFLLIKAGVSTEIRWKDLGKKNLNKLVNTLINDRYEVQGKTTFKEEFVTAGGISLHEVDVKTMQAKQLPGLFFAGEVLDIDGITGGFNFQAAWTTGFIAGKNAAFQD